ncbi:MAG: sigma-70 family RNA polymerase sigma factor [Saprospiraceae bacterium]|nr:sigma-70 family RNA polymerase sigma factor [Saprospiraceae bacterium]
MQVAELIKGCKRGESGAQRQLLEYYTPLLFSIALRYAVDRAQAKDILQDAWIKIFNGIIRYTHEGRLEGWMSKIVIHTALRKLDSNEMKRSVYLGTFFDPPKEDAKVLQELQYDDLLRIVNQLPPLLREIFKMHVIDGLKHKEIAELMDIQESTSRAHLTRAKKKLQELIRNHDKVEFYGE